MMPPVLGRGLVISSCAFPCNGDAGQHQPCTDNQVKEVLNRYELAQFLLDLPKHHQLDDAANSTPGIADVSINYWIIVTEF